MNEYAQIVPWQDNVRRSRKIGAMQAETKAERVKQSTQGHLRLRVAPRDPPHDRRTLSLSKDIHCLLKLQPETRIALVLVNQSIVGVEQPLQLDSQVLRLKS